MINVNSIFKLKLWEEKLKFYSDDEIDHQIELLKKMVVRLFDEKTFRLSEKLEKAKNERR